MSTLPYYILTFLILSFIIAIVSISIPSWIIVESGLNDPFAVMNGGFYTQSGLFELCQAVYDQWNCRPFDIYGNDCRGEAGYMNYCQLRRASAGLMITGVILALGALIYYGVTGFRKPVSKVAIIITLVLTSITTLFYIISTGLMVSARNVIQWSSTFAFPIGDPVMFVNGPRVYFGPAFALCIVAWALSFIALILIIVVLARPEKKCPKKQEEEDDFNDMKHKSHISSVSTVHRETTVN